MIDVAFKLVGDRGRWRELLAANPLRTEGDPRVRIPPSWFGYVPYSIPLRRVRELLARRRRIETAGPEEVAFEDAAGIDEAAFFDAGVTRPATTRLRSSMRATSTRPATTRATTTQAASMKPERCAVGACAG
ncbi:MAG: hypothetical protein IPN58_19970 [Anaerolineales bacterium]|nr:hypothetical protein [Anaerolineales bacterium]